MEKGSGEEGVGFLCGGGEGLRLGRSTLDMGVGRLGRCSCGGGDGEGREEGMGLRLGRSTLDMGGRGVIGVGDGIEGGGSGLLRWGRW